jgi:hypothetical protein
MAVKGEEASSPLPFHRGINGSTQEWITSGLCLTVILPILQLLNRSLAMLRNPARLLPGRRLPGRIELPG